MTAIIDLTDICCDIFAMFDQHVRQHYLLVACATFEVEADGTVDLAHTQRPLLREDVYHGLPGESSVRFEADIALHKPQAEVLVDAHAHAPGGKPAERVPVGLRVGPLRKDLVIYGERDRVDRLSGYVRPFMTMPIVYERTYGGPLLAMNPVGIGHKGARSSAPEVLGTIPNVERAGRRHIPAGYGPIARSWSPRRELSGTYDDRWVKQRAPLLPADFDSGFYQAAPPDQRLPELVGGERVELVNMTSDGYWSFALPSMDVPVLANYEDRSEALTLRWDTLLLEPQMRRFTLTGRRSMPVVRNRAPLREVIFGHASSAFQRSRVTGVRYVDLGHTGGRVRGRREFQ